MKRCLAALLLAVFAIISLGAADSKTQTRKTTKPAETIDQEARPADRLEKESPPSKREMKITRNVKTADEPEVVSRPGPNPAGPPTERQLTRASSRRFDVRTLPQTKPIEQERKENEPPAQTPVVLQGGAPSPEASLPSVPTPSIPAPAPIHVFEGLDRFNWGAGSPPDTNGDAGPNDYIQTVNTSIGIFNKSTGAQKAAFSFNTFMAQANFGNLCDTNNFGDPVVVYDTFEDRWIITDFAFLVDGGGNPLTPAYQCFAASMTGDPVAGGWNFYSIQISDALNDYPKFGIWPDGLYMTSNLFSYGAGAFQGVRVWAFNKAQMYAGSPTVKIVTFNVGGGDFTILPSNARLQTGTPPAGRPNLFLSTQLYLNALTVYKFHADWNSISLSTFTGPDTPISATQWPTFAAGVPQPGTATLLDSLSNRAMVQNQYTNFGGTESLWVSHTVRRATGGSAAPRWYQVNVTGGTVNLAIPQAATWDPNANNTIHRWMPSVALNRAGDLAMGYSTSSSTAEFPSIKYAGRLAADPVNTFSLTEQTLFTGTASQTGTTRWGDYSAMTLDPDGCTFWYTTEYANPADQTFNHRWLTKFGSFRYPSCVPLGAGGTVTGTVTATAGGAPVTGATIQFGARTTTTDGSGVYSFLNIPAGTYPSISAIKPGFGTSTATNVVVTDGGTTTQNFSLAAALASGCLTDTTQADFLTGILTNIDLTTSPGDVTLQNLAVDQQNTAGTTTGTGFGTPAWTGQTFIPAVTGQLLKAEIQLFCSGCGGAPPNLTLSVRNTAAGLPTGADLASVTIPGSAFGTGATVAFTGTFGSPATLTSGTQYALILRPVSAPAGSGYFWIRSSPSTYANGSRVLSADSGGTWSTDTTRDYNFKAYMQGPYAPPSGNLVSSTKDSNPATGLTPIWSALNWTATTPANTTLKFQVAASNNPNGPFTFAGPDGTAATFFTTSPAQLQPQFYNFRYLEYKTYLATTDSTQTPAVNDVSLCFTDVDCSSTVATIVPTPAAVCASSTGNSASGPAGMTAYAWSIANGTITTATNIQTITYTAGASGTVTLNLTVTAPNGCIVSGSTPVTISALSAPAITPTPAQVCANSVGDSAAGPAGATTYAWSIVNGTITSAANIQTITYTAGASGTVGLTLVVTNASNCSATNTVNVTINAKPATPAITPTPATVCANSTGNSAAGPAGATTYAWSIVNATITSATNIQTIAYTAGASGTVGLTLVVTNAAGCSATNTANVTINASPSTPSITPTPAQVCANSTGNSAAGPAGATTYAWSIVNGTITSATNIQTIAYTAGASGTVGLTLVVTNAGNCSATNTVNVTIANPATPAITPTPATVCANSTGNSAAGPAGATTYAWSIVNGTITSATNIQTITYSAGASGTVGLTLVVTNASNCSATNTANVTINPNPSAPTITPTPAAVCASSTGNSAASPVGATTYAWSIVNGTITSATNIQTVIYTAGTSGTVGLTLVVTNASGCSATNTANVTINAKPATPAITPAPAAVCANSTGNSAAGPAGATTYAWSIVNGTITSATNIQTITYTAGASGTVGLTLVVTNASNCSATNTVNVTINANPAAPTITPTPATVCANSTGNSAAGPAGAATYAWSIVNGTITSATNIQTITYTAGASGTVGLTLIVTNASNCSATNTVNVTINAKPATPAITPAPAAVCANSTGNSAAGPAGATTYAWSIVNGTITSAANIQTITYTAGASGTVGLTLVVTNASGCSATNTANVTVNPGANATITPAPATVCANSTGNSAAGPAGATTYAWSIVNGTITSATNIQTITYTAGASGTVGLTLVVTNASNCSATNTVNVTINATPAAPTITPTPATVCANSTGNSAGGPAGATTYAWSIVNGTITSASNIQTITYTAGASGTVGLTLVVTNASNCSATNTANVTINAKPATPAITPTPAAVCANSTGNSATGPAGATTYAWSIVNGTITSATNTQTIAYTAGASGTVGLTLVVTNASGCSAMNTANVTVNPNPNATITAPASVVANSTGNAASVANAGAGATYGWAITGGTITAGAGTTNITFTGGAGPGTTVLNVAVTTSTNCSDAKTANVTRTLPPVTVTSVSPAGGTSTGGTNVTVNGTGFIAGATVTLGGTAATNVVVVSAIKLTATTPAHAAGAINVTVTNTDASTGTLTSGYTYQSQVFDPNNDGAIDPADIFFLINYLFLSGPPPHGPGGVLSGDANGDGSVDPADIFYLVNYLFLGGQKPNIPAAGANLHTMAAGSAAPQIAGSIALGKAVLRAGHYVVPVILTSRGLGAPQAMSLRVHFESDAAIGEVVVRSAGAAKDVPLVFETSRRSDNDVSYLVAYDPRGLALGASRSAVVAEIEIESADSGIAISIDPLLTMLSNQAGTMKATVGNRNLEVSGMTIGSGKLPRPHAPGHEVN
jgi:hypothetical protein